MGCVRVVPFGTESFLRAGHEICFAWAMSRTARGLSLRTKWSLVLLGLALAPLVVLGPITLTLQRDGLMESENALQGAVASQATKSVAFTVSQISDAASRTGQLLVGASVQSERDKEAGNNLISLARAEVAATEHLAYLVIYDKAGLYLDAISRKAKGEAAPTVSKAPLPPEIAEAARRTTGTWTLLPNGSVAGGATQRRSEALTYTVPLVTATGEATGYVRAFVTEGALSELVATVSRERLGNANAVFLVDEGLRVVAAPPTGSLNVGDELRGKYMFSLLDAKAIPWDTPFQGVTGAYVGPSGETMRGAYSTLARHRWLIVVQRPESEALAALRGTQRAFVLAVLAVAVLAIALGSWLAARSTRPIEALVALTRRYAKRDFEARAEVSTGDELEELSSSLAEMAGSIRSGEAEIAKKTVTEAQLSRYLPAEVARSIADGTRTLGLGGERREVSVIFADIASFTAFAERSSPEDVVTFLNEVFSILSEVVFRHGGMVDKFMGDCIMAVFGATEPEGDPGRTDHASRALAAAEDMHRFVETQSAEWKKRFDFDVRLGVGVTSGAALVGNLGSETRMEFTAIGDAVNTAARLESLAQAGQTLVSGDIAQAVGDAYELRSLGPHPLRGKREPVELFELVL